MVRRLLNCALEMFQYFSFLSDFRRAMEKTDVFSSQNGNIIKGKIPKNSHNPYSDED